MPESRKRGASEYIGLGGRHPVDQLTLQNRFEDRARRQAADDRSEIERFLGVPPRNQSALAHRDVNKAIDSLITSLKRR